MARVFLLTGRQRGRRQADAPAGPAAYQQPRGGGVALFAPLRKRAVGVRRRRAVLKSGTGGLDRPRARGGARRRAGNRTRTGPQPRSRGDRKGEHGRPLHVAAHRHRHPFYDDAVIATERLTVPHPLLEERLFALLPLCEIARSKCHPVTGRTVGEMLENRKNEP